MEELQAFYSFQPVPPQRLSLGYQHTAVISSRSQLYTFGWNNFHQLGTGDQKDRHIPTLVSTPEPVRAVSCGYGCIFFITTSGKLYATGTLPRPEYTKTATPVHIPLPGPARRVSVSTTTGGDYVSDYHVAILLEDGQVYTLGCNYRGELGTGNRVGHSTPVQVPLPEPVADVSTSGGCTVILTESGSVYLSGDLTNLYGQGSLVPLKQLLPEKAIGISAANRSISILLESRTVHLLELNTARGAVIARLVRPDFPIAVVISNAALLSCTGDLYTYGRNDFGQLGTDDLNSRFQPTPIAKDVASVSRSGLHSAYLTTKNLLYTFGYNGCGQLGFGDTNHRTSPTLVVDLSQL